MLFVIIPGKVFIFDKDLFKSIDLDDDYMGKILENQCPRKIEMFIHK